MTVPLDLIFDLEAQLSRRERAARRLAVTARSPADRRRFRALARDLHRRRLGLARLAA